MDNLLRYATVTVVRAYHSRPGEREYNVHDLKYDGYSDMFSWVRNGKLEAFTREHVICYREWDGKRDTDV